MASLSAQSTASFPLVTVITVVYQIITNQRTEQLKRCFASIHSQDYPNIEHIVIDGASTDGSIAILAEYQERGLLQYYSEADQGIYDAMNKGLTKAQGEYIHYLNSDDYFTRPDAIRLLAEALIAKPQAAFSFGNWNEVHKEVPEPVYKMRSGKRQLFFGKCSYRSMYVMKICHQAMLYRKNVIEELGGFDLRYSYTADADLHIRTHMLGKTGTFVPVNLVNFTVFASKTSNDVSLYAHEYVERLHLFYGLEPFVVRKLMQNLGSFNSLFRYFQISHTRLFAAPVRYYFIFSLIFSRIKFFITPNFLALPFVYFLKVTGLYSLLKNNNILRKLKRSVFDDT